MNLPLMDLLLVVVLLGSLIWVGFWSRRFVRSVAEFTIAGRKMGMWLGLSTGLEVGLISIAMNCQMGFKNGFSYIWLSLAALLLINVPLFGLLGIGIKRYRATQVHTLPQYYEMRYSRPVRIFAGITLAIGGVLNMAIFPIVESYFLMEFLRIPNSVVLDAGFYQFTAFHVVLATLLALATFFTMIGGMVTGIITDYIQVILVSVTLLVISAMILRNPGLGGVKTAVETGLGDAGFNPLSKNSIGVVFVIVFLLGSIIQRLAFPPALQKMSSTDSAETVRRMTLVSSIFGQGRGMILVVWGIAALALFGPGIPTGCDPEIYGRTVGAKLIRTMIEGMPLLTGFVLTGFIFASISCNDTYLLSWGSVIANDCVCAVRGKPFSRKAHIRVLQLSALAVAVLIFIFGCWYSPKETILQFFYLTGAIFGACGLLTWFGLYWKRTTSAGAWVCLVLGLALPIGWFLFQKYGSASLDAPGREHLKRWINNDTAALVATVLPALVMVIVSLCSRGPTRFVDYGERLREIEARDEAAGQSGAGEA